MQPPTRHRIALVGPDRQVYLHDLPGDFPHGVGGGKRTPVTLDPGMTYDWPTWSPDGRRLAFLAAPVGEPRGRVRLLLAELPGRGPPVEIYSQSDFSPFYLSWAPDGSRIALLGGAPDGLRLRIVPADGSLPPRWSIDGQPNFFSWRPDSSELLVHRGGSAGNPDSLICRVDARTGDVKRLTLAPAAFRAPSWSADGKAMLVAAMTNDGQGIVSMDQEGNGTVLAVFPGSATFQWSPAGQSAAALMVPERRETPGGSLYLLDITGGHDLRLSGDDEVLAFWWSPDGRHIAYMAADTARHLLVLNVLDTEKGGRMRVASLAPSDSTMLLLTFFDQYALSASFWSPDGRYFAYAGHTFREQSNGHEHHEAPELFVVPTDGSAPPRSLGQGLLGVWSPIGG